MWVTPLLQAAAWGVHACGFGARRGRHAAELRRQRGCRTISFFVSNLSRQAERKETLENIGEDVFAIAVDQPFRFPATFTFVLRAFTTLEGVSKGLDPEYNFANEATPYARALLDLEGDSASNRQLAVAELQKRAVRLGNDAVALPSRVEYLESTLRRYAPAGLRCCAPCPCV